MIEKILHELTEAKTELREATEEKIAALQEKSIAEDTVKEYKALASMQGIGTKKEHGNNADARKQYLNDWLNGHSEYVSALGDIRSIDYDMIKTQETIAYRTKQIIAIQAEVECLKIVAMTNSARAAIAGL